MFGLDDFFNRPCFSCLVKIHHKVWIHDKYIFLFI